MRERTVRTFPLRCATLALLAVVAFDASAAPCPTTSVMPPAALQAATVGVALSQPFSAASSNGGPFTFEVTSGLPAGMGLDFTSTGPTGATLGGLPTQAGSYLITVTATDNLGCGGGRTYALEVAQGSQTISFTSSAPADAQIGGDYETSAIATSGLPVAFSIDASANAVCSLAGSSVTFTGAGTCVVNANQPGDANWNPAPQAQQSFAVSKASQTIAFTSVAPASARVGGPVYSVSAAASSGLPVGFTIDASASSVCSIAGSSVSFLAAGTCVINADQPGDATWSPAPEVQQSFAVAPGEQTIAFTSTAPAAVVAGPDHAVAAVATSGLPVVFTIDASASAVCSIAGSNVSFQAAGTCVVNANQPGSANWNAAPQVQQSFAVAPGNQTINFTSSAPTDARFGGAAYVASATATSGLPVALSIDASAGSVCSISGSSVTFVGAGTCVVNANQPGNANWNAAPQVQQSFAVAPGSQTISFTSTPPATVAIGQNYVVAATATSGLPVAFTIDASASGVCSLTGFVVGFSGIGDCVINANQAGNDDWLPAPQVQQTVTVSPCLALDVGQVATPGPSFCVTNPSAVDAEFAYLPINNSPILDSSALALSASGIQDVSGPPLPRPAPDGFTLAPLQEPFALDQHAVTGMPDTLPLGREHTASDLVAAPRGGVTPLVLGQLIDIDVSVGCSVPTDVRKARVAAITTPQFAGQQRVYALQEVVESSPGAGDWAPPVAGGYAQIDMQNIIDAFVQPAPGSTPGGSGSLGGLLRTGMFGTATNLLGELTDLDGNGGLIVMFTRKLNELSPPASSASVPAMFQPRDLFASASCPGSNEGEILYLMVPDPTGQVNSNVRTLSFAYGNATPALVHHFEHLLNATRRLYFNAAPLEQTWLDEGLAWLFQEMAFFNAAAGLGPRGNIQLSTLTTGPNASVRVAAFNAYQNPMFAHMRSFFYQLSPSTNGNKRFGPLRETVHTTGGVPNVHETSASNFAVVYSFLRYALDRKNTGDAALLSALVNTTQLGRANLQSVLGVDLDTWARDFLIAAYADDANIAGTGPEHSLPTWNFRSVYTGLGGFPLATNPLSDGVSINFLLGAGGGTRYTRFGVAPGGTANVTLQDLGGGAPAATISGAILRTR